MALKVALWSEWSYFLNKMVLRDLVLAAPPWNWLKPMKTLHLAHHVHNEHGNDGFTRKPELMRPTRTPRTPRPS